MNGNKKTAAPVSLEIPMQILKPSHANNSNCRAHLVPVGEQLGFPVAGGFRCLHIHNQLTAEHQRPPSGSLIKTEIHVSPVTYYAFSTPLLNWARDFKRSQALLQGWNLKHAPRMRTAVDFWRTPNFNSTQRSNLGHETLCRVLRVASGAVQQTRGC